MHESQYSKHLEVANRKFFFCSASRKVNQVERVAITASFSIRPRAWYKTIVEADRLIIVTELRLAVRQGAVLLSDWVMLNTLSTSRNFLAASRHLDHTFDRKFSGGGDVTLDAQVVPRR